MTRIPINEAVKLMERTKLREAIRNCPVCLGTGELDHPDNMGPSVPKCPICRGMRFVDLDSICNCGMPAVFFKDDVFYCGRDLCLNGLRRRLGLGA